MDVARQHGTLLDFPRGPLSTVYEQCWADYHTRRALAMLASEYRISESLIVRWFDPSPLPEFRHV